MIDFPGAPSTEVLGINPRGASEPNVVYRLSQAEVESAPGKSIELKLPSLVSRKPWVLLSAKV
jgi:hypothetical protein